MGVVSGMVPTREREEKGLELKHHITPNLLFHQRGGEASFSNPEDEVIPAGS